MIGTLAWKEYKEQRAVWASMAWLAIFLLAVAQMLVKSGILLDPADQAMVILGLAAIMAGSYGVVCGAILLAGERDTQTLSFLDALTCLRAPLWKTKMAAGVLLTLAYALPVTATVLVLGVGVDVELPSWLLAGAGFLLLALVGLVALAWGMLSSAVMNNVLTAAVFGICSLPLVLLLTTSVVGFVGGGPIELTAVAAILVGGSLWGSWRIFCGPDRARMAHGRVLGASVPPQGWAVLLWLTWRQGKQVIAALASAALVMTIALMKLEMPTWPVLTGLIGITCGIAAFAPEQLAGTERFLGNMRLPPGRIWAAKILFWLAAAGACATLVLALELSAVVHYPEADPALAVRLGPGTFLTLWLVVGFSVAQLLAVLIRKTVVAAFLAVPLTGGLLILWLPSLVGGGVSAWQWLGVPCLLLAASRCAVWPWCSGTLVTWRPWLVQSGLVLLVFAWLAGAFWHRAVEVPAVGEPFDVAAYEASLPTVEENRAGRLIDRAAKELTGQLSGGGANRLHDLEKVPPGDWTDGAQGQWLETLCAGAWATHLREAAALPLGMIKDPRETTREQWGPTLEGLRHASAALRYRAVQLQAKGDDAGALDQLAILLALSRQLRSHTAADAYLMGVAVEKRALESLALWQQRLGAQPKLLTRALEELTRHEAQIPPLTDQVKAQYLAFRFTTQPRAVYQDRDWPAVLLQAPWEKCRLTRLGDAIFSGWLCSAETDYWRLPPVNIALADEPIGPWLLGAWLPPEHGPGAHLTADRLGRWIDESQLATSLPCWPHLRRAAPQSLRDVRAARLQLAVALYQTEQQKPPSSMQDLVPCFLPAILVDPVTGLALPTKSDALRRH